MGLLLTAGLVAGPSFRDAPLGPTDEHPFYLTELYAVTEAPSTTAFTVPFVVSGETTTALFTCDQIACPNDYSVDCAEDADPDFNNINHVPHFENKCTPPTHLRYEDEIDYDPDNPAYGAVITRTWYGTSENGIVSSCTMQIFILDTDPPVPPAPPGDLTVECAEDVPPPEPLTAEDHCDGTIDGEVIDVKTDIKCENQYTIIRTWTFTDRLGNSSSVSQTITVEDLTPPELTVPADVSGLSCDASTSPDNTGMATATDNCGGEVFIDYTDVREDDEDGNCYIIKRVWYAKDACDNISSHPQHIEVVDNEPPVFTNCPRDMVVNHPDEIPPVPENIMAEDNCDSDVLVTYHGEETSGSCPDGEYTLTRRWTATDYCDNSTECVQVITVKTSTSHTNDCYSIDPTIEYSEKYNATRFTWKLCLIGDDCKDISNIRFSLPCELPTSDVYRAYASIRGLNAEVDCRERRRRRGNDCNHDHADHCDKEEDGDHEHSSRCTKDDDNHHDHADHCDKDEDRHHEHNSRCTKDDDDDDYADSKVGDRKSYRGDDDDDKDDDRDDKDDDDDRDD
ncbi:hypothetical protein CGL56_15950, partial [Neolewinella marina]